MSIPKGFVLIETPHSRDAARAVLAAAEQAKYPPQTVKAVAAGYLIPAGAEDHYVPPGAAPTEEPQDESEDGPDESWKNADIEAYAAERDIDLDGATKKADMLAAIAAAEKES
jgi:hypothetical protein